jgi:transcriptional regulator with XRE-family HTH domain
MAKANSKSKAIKVKSRDVKALCQHLDKLRTEKGWSMREMADYCDINKSQVNNLTKTGVDFRYSTLVKIAKGFGIEMTKLLDF